MTKSQFQPFEYVLNFLFATILLAISPFLDQSFTASAQSDGEEPNPVVESYAEAFDLPYAEAQRRLQLQTEMDKVEAQVREGEPTYAGSWTQHEPEFGLTVAFASPDGDAIIKKYLDGIAWADLVQVQQARYTVAELDSIFEQVTQAARETKVHFEAGANYRTGKVDMYTPEPDALRSQLQAMTAIDAYLDDIEFKYQESMSAPAQSKYPYLPGGHPISTCTTGLVLTRNSDGRRFMSTSGHCSNNQYARYNGTDDVYIGPVVFENDPEGNVGVYGDDIDLQVHDVSARSLDLTNVIRTGATSTDKVAVAALKANTLNDWVCKYGKVSNLTCGFVVNLSYAPGGAVYGTSDDYVRVDKPPSSTIDMACPGDSGSPVFEYEIGGMWGLGVLSGREAADCTGNNVDFFFYTPVDEINRAGFSVLTTHHQQRCHQNVFWSETSCIEYRTPYDDNGNPIAPSTTQPCSTSAPGSGTIETYTGWVSGNYWREGMWRGGIGYVRNVPLNSNGTINWGAAPGWTQCCSGAAPRSQDAYIVGNHYYQNVFWSETNCTEYRRPLDDNGNGTGTQTSQPCRATAPGSGTITSYTAYVVGGRLREGIWRGGIGYVRDVPLNSTNTDIDWAQAPAWQQCCSGTPTRAQGGDVLSYP